MRLTFDVIGASMHENESYREHPQKVMKDLGFKLICSEPCPIADCWHFEVEENDIELPSFLEEWSGKFTHEMKKEIERLNQLSLESQNFYILYPKDE